MSNTRLQRKSSLKFTQFTTSSVLASALAIISSGASEAKAVSFSALGTGAEIRQMFNDIKGEKSPSELSCASDSKKMTDKKTQENTAAKDDTTKSVKNKDMKTAEGKCGEGKCGEGKCGGEMKTDKKAETDKHNMKTSEKAKTEEKQVK